MQQLTNEEKAKVFNQYPNAPVYGGNPFVQFGTMQGVILNRSVCTGLCGLNNSIPNYYKIQHCKLGLIPLSSITDEHAIDVAKVLGYELETGAMLLLGKDYCKDFLSRPCIGSDWRKIMVYHYLISKGYDVPLFFGVGHPCNGMTAIQLGIAIDKNTLS